MSRVFIVAGLVMFGALAQAQQPYGSTRVDQNGAVQYDGLWAQPQYRGPVKGQPYNPQPDNHYNDGGNYVESPTYDNGNSDGYSDGGDYGDNNYDGGGYDDYQGGEQQPPSQGQPSPDEMDQINQSVLNATNGACNIKENPHSFGCTEWTFTSNSLFPLFPMDWRGLQGEWFTVTYVNPTSGNNGREFYMAKNPQRPTQPMGVKNKEDDSLVGRLSINGNQVTFENWRGRQVSSNPESFRVVDNFTVQFDLLTGRKGQQTLHSFNCRDFNRNGGHHLLCDWSVKTGPGERDWLFKGYFGFITLDAWQGFLSQAGQN